MKITTFMKIIVFTAYIEYEWINYARLIAKKCLLFSKFPSSTFWTPKLFRNSKSKLLYLRKLLNMILLFWKGVTLPQNLLLGSSVSRSTAGVPFSFVSEICSRNGRSISWGSDPGFNPSEPIGFNPCARFPTFPEFSCLFVLPRWEVSVPHTLLTRFNFSLRTLIYHIESV